MAMTEQAVKHLTNAIDSSNVQSTDLVTTRMVAFFQGTSPRVYCPDSPAFGHLSNTLAILKRFIALGFIAKAEIVYQNADVLTKLRTLLPQIPDNPPFVIPVSSVGKTALVTLTLMPKQTPLEPAEKFAITGGWDHPDDAKAVAALLNVDCLVAVQPYLWEITEPKAYDCAYFRRTDTMVKLVDLIPDLGQMLYLRPPPAVSPDEWSQLAALPNMGVKIPAVRAVVDGVNAGGLLFCPAYGISNVGTKVPASAPSPSSVLFNMCSTIRLLQVNGSQRFRKGAVILVLTELSSSAWTLLKAWVTGKSLFDPPETLKSFIAQYLYPQSVETVLVREKLEKASEISQAIANITSGQVLILNIQSLPSDVFELCYGMATLPSILEGAGTAGLVMNFRTPYFRFNGQGYPVFPFGAQPSPQSLLAASRRDLVNTLLKAWSKVSNEVPPLVLAQYFEDCYATDSPMQSYFAQFAAILQDPGNDKFFAALRMVFVCDAFQKNFQQLMSAAPMRLAITAGDPVLDEVYQKLESNLSGGTLNVVPGAFSEGQIAALYRSIATGGIFTVTKAAVTPPSNGEVLVTGSTDSLLGFPGLDVHLVFTDGELGLTSTLQIGRSDVSWNLSNVPWFALSAPRFDIVQTDNEAPTSGAVGSSIRLGDTTADVSLALPIQLERWAFEATLTGTQPSIASVFQLVGGINLVALLPPPLNAFTDLALQALEVMYDGSTNSIGYFSIQIGTTRPWPLFGNITLGGLTIAAMVTNPGNIGTRAARFVVTGTFPVGPGSVEVQVAVPDLVFSGTLVAPADTTKEVVLGDLVSLFLPKGQTVPIDGAVQELDFAYNQPQARWNVGCVVRATWPIPPAPATPWFTIEEIGFSVGGNGSQGSGSFSGSVVVLPDSAKIGISLLASYATATGWVFEGRQTSGEVALGDLLSEYLGWNTDQKYGIDGLGLTIATKDSSWVFTGKTAEPWDVPFIPGLTVQASLTLGYNGGQSVAATLPAMRGTTTALVLEQDKTPGFFARLETEWTWENIDIRIWFDYNPAVSSFGITWGVLEGVVQGPDRTTGDYVATLKFTDAVTLGSMVETMVSWITGSKFGLEAPWNVLDSISLSGLALNYTFNPQDSTRNHVSFAVGIGPINLGFARIDGVDISYSTADGVMVALTGSFPWNTGDTGTLGPWDASKPGTAPAPPGNGNKYLDLRLLAMGQHVTIDCLRDAGTIQAAIDCMEKLPDPKPGEIPDVTFDPSSSWLVGTDFGILKLDGGGNGGSPSPEAAGSALAHTTEALERTRGAAVAPAAAGAGYFITLQIVFNDPYLYGLRIALEGEPAKIFKGLDFQIMYRQVSPTVGVYQAEITLPDAMRNLSIGAYSITLPVFGISVYTNGDFLLDIGFPWNEDFSRSFTIQGIVYPGIPVMGSAGFYFGKLSSATTNKVPQTTKGTFNPVIVFGLGLQVGFGKSVQYGVLSAGFSVTVFGILEGVIGKWNPYALTDGSQGEANQLQGAYYFWLRGTVGVLGKLYGTVDFSIIKADVNVEVKLLVQLTYESYVSLSVTVLASVDISVSVRIDLGLFKVTIHFSFSMRLKETFTIDNSGTPPWGLPPGPPPSVLRSPADHRLRATRRLAEATGLALTANWQNLLSPPSPVQLAGWVVPALSIAHDEWQDQPWTPGSQQPVSVALLVIDSVAPPTPETLATAAADAPGDTSFEALCKMVLRLAIAAIQDRPYTPGDVDGLIVSDTTLGSMLDNILTSTDANPTPLPPAAIDQFMANQFQLTLQVPPMGTVGEANATFFPVPPAVRLVLPAYGSDYPGYDYAFGDYNSVTPAGLTVLREYFADLAVQVQQEMHPGGDGARAAIDAGPLSMGTWVFADYFLLLARQMVQAAREGLRDFKYPIQAGQTARSVCAWINTTGQLSGDDAYSLFDLFTANQTHLLQAGRTLTIGVRWPATDPAHTSVVYDLTTMAAVFGGAVAPSAIAATNAADGTVLRPGATVAYPGKTPYTIQSGDTLIGIAGALGVSFGDLVGGANLLTQADLLAPAATLLVPLVTYQALAGDTFTSIAALATYGAGFTAAALATANAGQAVLQPGAEIVSGTKTYRVVPGDCLGDVATGLGVSFEDLLTTSNVLTLEDLLAPVALLALPPFPYRTVATDDLQQVASRFAVALQVIADQPANGDVVDLFATVDQSNQPTPYLDVPHLAQFKVGELIGEAQRSGALAQLSGMVSRYHLHGLRLPTADISPSVPGMWVRGEGSDLQLPAHAGLFALTGQQFPLPTIDSTGTFTITLDRSAGPAWLEFEIDGSSTSNLPIPIAPGSDDATRISKLVEYATNTRLDVEIDSLGADSMYSAALASYPFTTSLTWQAASAVNLPYGTPSGGVQALRIWALPGAMVGLAAPSGRAIRPRMSLQTARYDQATGKTVQAPVTSYGWVTTIPFTVKRVPPGNDTPGARTTYELVGAGGPGIALLERLLDQVQGDDAAFDQLILGYPPDQTGAATEGVQTDAVATATMGIAQVNLSTVTRPPTAGALAAMRQTTGVPGLLNKPSEFLRLLWEASITRDGGFYLYYYDGTDQRGLPDRVFTSNDQANLTLIVVYARPASVDDEDRVTDFMNGAATGEAIDVSDTVVFAQADPPATPQQIPTSTSASLASIATGYYSDVGDLAQENSGLALATGAGIVVSEGVFQAPPGGISLADVATRFATTEAALRAANARTTLPDPLQFPDAIWLPRLVLTVGTSAHATTLGDIAGFYGENLTALAAHNREVPGVFALNQSVRIPGGPQIRSATVPPGVQAVGGVRKAPDDVPLDPNNPDFARLFLLNAYSLLNYQVAGNPYFRASNLGLPAGPSTQGASPDVADKIRAPKPVQPGDPWDYRQAMPFAKFARPTPPPRGTLAASASSPYLGIGDILQVAFTWQDYYGNTVVTTLSDPQSGDPGPFTEAPMPTGYVDPLVGLGQWPSVSSAWQVLPGTHGGLPTLELLLTFDASRYQGLIVATASTPTTITATFTETLDPASAADASNYQVSGATVLTAQLQPDNVSVTLTVTSLTAGTYALSATNVRAAGPGAVLTGQAGFSFPDDPAARTSAVQANATQDLRIYATLQDQLTDPNGIAYWIDSSLLEGTAGAPGSIALTSGQEALLLGWLFDAPVGSSSIAGFLADRAVFATAVAPPPPSLGIDSELGDEVLASAEIFELSLSFRIVRTGGVVLGDLETQPGIRQTSAPVAALQRSVDPSDGSSTIGLSEFAQNFEAALSVPGNHLLRVAVGVDRTQVNPVSSGATLFAVRLGLAATEPISYTVTAGTMGNPALFSPRPVSNTLQTRRGVPIYPYQTGQGIGNTPQDMDFVDIDLDVWCQQIFGSIDGVLSPLYTAAMQIVDARKQTDYLDQILAAKQALAAIVKDWMIPVFAGETADPAAVREDFYQQLLVRLSNAYTTSAGVQFEAAVVADVHEPSAEQPPRLYGDVLLPEFAGATVDAVHSTVLLTFRVTLGPSAGDPANYAISGGISVGQAVLSPDRTTVTLTLASDVTPGTTTVTVSNLVDDQGSPLLPPFTQTVLETGGGQTTDSISFTSPKLTLQSGRQPLSLLVTSPGTVKGPGGELLAYVDVDLTYRGASIEHQIGDVAGIDGYQASSWLSFVLQGGQQPLTADLGGFPIPLPLRAFPTTPTMAAQSGDASYPDVGDDLSKATKWDYSFTYSLPYHYPQDRVDGVVEFNVQQVAGAMAAVEDAFAQLAEFVAVFPSVDADFQSIVGTIDATTTDATTIENAAIAISSFHQLMNDIVVAANGPGLIVEAPPRALGGAPDLTFSFFIEEGIVEATGALLVSLVVVGSLPDGLQSPTVLVDPRNYDCVPYTGTPDDGTDCDEPGRYCFVYKQKDAPGDYLTAAVGQAVADRTVVLPGLDILQRQDAWSTVSIERNKVLVPGKPSAEPFVYSTPMVRFANPLHPSIDAKAPINMSEITTPPPPDPVPISRSLLAHIEALFAALLVSNSQPTLTIQVEVAYAYPLNPLLEPIVLPVLMQAPLDVAITAQGASGPLPLAEMTQNWATAVTRWFSTRTPPLTGGQLLFDLRIMSNLTEHPMPLVQLEQLFLPVEWIVPPLG